MALTNFKTQPVVQDDRELMCSVQGCAFRWSVKMDGSRPFCSKHAWEDKNLGSQPAPVAKHWTDEEQF